ncbi:MAG: ComEC/Rec2 family competence protein [Christensenella sp.]|nr:ComEC/Rec2 family competence protein [Christensenella sp.]
MKLFSNRRPIAFFALCLTAGITISYYLKIPVALSFVCLLACIPIFIFLFYKIPTKSLLPLYAAVFFLGAFLFQIQFQTDFSEINSQTEYKIQGYIANRENMSEEYHTYTLENVIIAQDGKENAFSKKVILYSEEKLDYGATIVFNSKIKEPMQSRNPGGFDDKMYLASKGAGFSCFVYEVRETGSNPGWYAFPLMLRETLSERIDQIFSTEYAPVAKAMFLGEDGSISDEMRENFSKTGIAHILAISGLHVMIISYAMNFLLKKCKIRRKIRFSINIAFLVFYAVLTGLAPSVMRAVLMTVFVIIGRWMFFKRRDTLTFFSAAMLITLLLNAPQLFMPGFLMSYGIVFGLLCITPPLTRFFNKAAPLEKTGLAPTFAVSLSTTCAAFPLTAYYFRCIALAAPIANLFAIPLAAAIVLFTGAGSLLALISLPVGHAVAFPAELCIRALDYFNGMIANTAFGYFEVYGFPIFVGIAIFIVLFLCSDYVFWRKKTKAIIAAVVCGALCLGMFFTMVPAQGQMKTVVLDVGTGDAIHVSVDGKNYLIDNGGNLQYSQIDAYAEDNRLTFDAVIITNDRTKNLKNLAAQNKIKMLWIPENYIPKEYDQGLLMQTYALYDKIELSEDAYVTVVGADHKHLSLTLYYKNKPVCLLMQNNADGIVLKESVPVIKIANSGAKGVLTGQFLADLAPEYGIISVKKNDSKGNPSDETLKLLEKYGASIFTTAENGAITITSDGNKVEVSAKQ